MASESIAELNIALRGTAKDLAADIARDMNSQRGRIQTSSVAMGNLIAAGIGKAVAAVSNTISGAVSSVTDAMARMNALMNENAVLKVSGSFRTLTDAIASMIGKSSADVNAAITSMQDKIGKISLDPNGRAAKAFNAIKLDIEGIRKLAPEQQFEKIVGALRNVKEQSLRTFASNNIFGGGSDFVLRYLKESKQSIAEMTEQAKLFGLVMSTDAIDAVGAAADRLDHIKFIWQGIGNQLAVAVAPYINGIVNAIDKMITDMGGIPAIMQRVVETLHAWLVTGMDVAQVMSRIWETIKTGYNTISNLGAIVVSVVKGVGSELEYMVTLISRSLQNALSTIEAGLRKLVNKIKGEIASLRDFADEKQVEATTSAAFGISNSASIMSGIPGQSAVAPDASLFPTVPMPDRAAADQAWSDVADVSSAAMDQIAKDGSDLSKYWGAEWWSNSIQPIQDLTKETYQATAGLMDDVGAKEDASIEARSDAKKKALDAEYKNYEQTLNSEAEAHARAMEQIRQQQYSVVADMVTGWITGTGRMSDIISGWANDMIKQMIQVSLFGNSVFGGLFGTGSGTGSWISAISGIFGGAHANGGRPPMGKVSLVGERGPELFVPDSAGRIIPNNQLQGSLGESRRQQRSVEPIIITQNFASGITRAELAGMAEQIKAETVEAVAQQNENGGSYRRRLT